MKQRIFTLMSMVALVLVANIAFGANTKYTPYVGSAFDYTVAGTTSGDSINFYVTLSSVVKPIFKTEAVNVASATIASGHAVRAYRAFISSGADITINVTWNEMPATGTTYLLWVQAKDAVADGCTNYRYMTITPLDYVVDFVVTAYGFDEFTGTPTEGSADITECWPTIADPEVTLAEQSLTETSSSTLYYTVKRVAYTVAGGVATEATATVGNDWEFTPTLTGTATTLSYGTVSGTYGSTWTSGTAITPVASGTDVLYFEVEIPLSTTDDRTFTLAITDAKDINGKADNDNTASPTGTLAAANSASVDVSRLPAIGAFN